ncbi:MAG: hypothetical protein M1438_09750 [Deltaproteobacteria bacterium]|nr:hypothetical protein [Deltaproteobacteria bacterium]
MEQTLKESGYHTDKVKEVARRCAHMQQITATPLLLKGVASEPEWRQANGLTSHGQPTIRKVSFLLV